MPAESPYWPKPARNPELFDPSLTLDGRQLFKIDGTWCAETRAGTWRPAQWLGSVSVGQLLDHLHRLQTSEAST